MSAIVVPTPHIKERYKKINANTVEICNFPLHSEILNLETNSSPTPQKLKLCYIGGVSLSRGIKQMIIAAGKCDIELAIAGNWPEGLVETMAKADGWDNVKQLGFLNREELSQLKRESLAGFVLLAG